MFILKQAKLNAVLTFYLSKMSKKFI